MNTFSSMILQERSSNIDPFLSKIQRKTKATSYEFIVKLLTILENPQYAGIFSWSTCGKCILLKDQTKIANEILPKHFNHSKIPTLIRQLNYYGFRKVSSNSGQHVYSNPNFQKDRPDLLSNIKREKKKSASEADQNRQPLTQNDSESETDLVQHLMKKLAVASRIIENLELENEFLWKQRKTMGLNRNLVGQRFYNPRNGLEILEFNDEDTMLPDISNETEFVPHPFRVSLQHPNREMPESLDAYSSFDQKYFEPEELQRPQTHFQNQPNRRENLLNNDQESQDLEESSITFTPFQDQDQDEDQDYFN
mmetsp:Transcript_15095/g.17419  ORF Transcript_15095/g.17419 Transcript_15095/m.17419 type:complete len:309 (-) Transcript_15095:119-1045(-)